jgi:hypothetical protein
LTTIMRGCREPDGSKTEVRNQKLETSTMSRFSLLTSHFFLRPFGPDGIGQENFQRLRFLGTVPPLPRPRRRLATTRLVRTSG